MKGSPPSEISVGGGNENLVAPLKCSTSPLELQVGALHLRITPVCLSPPSVLPRWGAYGRVLVSWGGSRWASGGDTPPELTVASDIERLFASR